MGERSSRCRWKHAAIAGQTLVFDAPKLGQPKVSGVERIVVAPAGLDSPGSCEAAGAGDVLLAFSPISGQNPRQ